MELVIAGLIIAVLAVVATNQINISRRIGRVLAIRLTDDCHHEWEVVTNDKIETDNEIQLLIIQKCVVCGRVDKTIEGVEKSCKHNWKVIKDIKQNSPLEDMDYETKEQFRPGPFNKNPNALNEKWLHRSKRTIICACSKCGELDKTVSFNIEDEE